MLCRYLYRLSIRRDVFVNFWKKNVYCLSNVNSNCEIVLLWRAWCQGGMAKKIKIRLNLISLFIRTYRICWILIYILNSKKNEMQKKKYFIIQDMINFMWLTCSKLIITGYQTRAISAKTRRLHQRLISNRTSEIFIPAPQSLSPLNNQLHSKKFTFN